ncbi:DciA family protein [Thermodesulfobacterium hydrogeniphilum]|uniref:DciA family protein n=1 Tax=Thermodesulfobacterium hydrogeniphilum TaxID=161156 RepID=UPI0005707E07|nr:DciA family protein [Thermodesulfobacterium hydrogeniphilum]
MLKFKELFFESPFIPAKIKKNVIALEIAQKYWESIVGKKFVNKIKPSDFREGILFIEVPNHYYLQMLSPYSLEILERLENKVPSELKPLFCEVRFKINPYLSKKNNYLTTQKKNFKPEEIETISENICNSIEDKEIKEIFKRVIEKYLFIK